MDKCKIEIHQESIVKWKPNEVYFNDETERKEETKKKNEQRRRGDMEKTSINSIVMCIQNV